MYAAIFEHDDAAAALLELGADGAAGDDYGATAYDWAASNGHDSVVAVLAAYGYTE